MNKVTDMPIGYGFYMDFPPVEKGNVFEDGYIADSEEGIYNYLKKNGAVIEEVEIISVTLDDILDDYCCSIGVFFLENAALTRFKSAAAQRKIKYQSCFLTESLTKICLTDEDEIFPKDFFDEESEEDYLDYEDEDDEDYYEEILEALLLEIDQLQRKFSESSWYNKLNDCEKEESDFVISTFSEYTYNYTNCTLEEWNKAALEEICLYILPAKISAGENYYSAIAPVLSSFFQFLQEEKMLPQGNKLAEEVEKIAPQIIKNSSKSENWGMAKSIFMAGKEAGFDMETPEGLAEFQKKFNAKILQHEAIETAKRLPAKNAPCPCGSGRKYKGCCGKGKV